MSNYDQQDFETFALPEINEKPQTSYSLAIIMLITVSCFLRFFRIENEIWQTLVQPECFSVGMAGLMGICYFLDFNLKIIGIFLCLGFLIAFR